ncbi:unnamed protein product [Pleuronectes platessa]|uniref:Uncharacterized protein n=1 Tax=Pleuronectes platessa TaxID=8262 RepID=A0A9N7UZM2_PLEPL|nr:unnamed protein product [Pleuronectes platessa]
MGQGGVPSSSQSGSTFCSSKYGYFWFQKTKMALNKKSKFLCFLRLPDVDHHLPQSPPRRPDSFQILPGLGQKRPLNTIQLHRVQLFICMLSFLSPFIDIAPVTTWPNDRTTILFVTFLFTNVLPRLLSQRQEVQRTHQTTLLLSVLQHGCWRKQCDGTSEKIQTGSTPLDHQDTAQPPSTHTDLFTLTFHKDHLPHLLREEDIGVTETHFISCESVMQHIQ